ncbi:3-phosphoshikimate 1-carboxyvinyltransferase [Neobacillus notoginsengisoli]|uniref:3-phosphoshikimate 1-carboxyvinyltransferase n=1 Tax=Neobacillus notoginsengisoli TaxID=1578198 RepID=A0A417YVC0_9BACI|nr:3-phosphoshikimate 1-carboxyvinyltransferase [Neobacillus notoginsengisoli]RHW41253.1 3-phosphoshikimate 1-carboxyvinyltransferase [Neobacillus notoginsengisoli]
MEPILLEPAAKGLYGELKVPGDKSISHRAVMFGAISSGITTAKNFLPGEDCLNTVSCFRKLGVDIETSGTEVRINGKGLDGLKEFEGLLDVGNSGTTIRLMMGLLSGRPFTSHITGDESIAKRPMNRVTSPLLEMGAKIEGRENGKYAPITISGGRLNALTYSMPVASAQVKSAVLLAGLQAEGETVIKELAPTRDHTERMIRLFGGNVTTSGKNISIKGGQQLKAADIEVPGDISSAAFFLAAGSIVPGSEILLRNVGLNWTRSGIFDVMEKMGANLSIDRKEESFEPVGDIRINYSKLKGTTIEGGLIPRLIDELPIIALLGTQAEGETIIRDAAELRVKETDRIETVAAELRKLGAQIETTDDGMVITGGTNLHGGTVSSHGDHRIGMMLAIASLICKKEVTLEDPASIAISYPNFFTHLAKLR